MKFQQKHQPKNLKNKDIFNKIFLTLRNKTLKHSLLFSEKHIQEKVKTLADQINTYYGSKNILVIGILKGAFVFYSDLLKYLNSNLICDFISISYYGGSKRASSEATINLDVSQKIKNQNVLLIDCIVDYGHTIEAAKKHIQQRQPESIKTVALITKPAAHTVTTIDFSGFQVEQDVFVIGYGIDYKNYGRHLPYFAQLIELN